MSISRKDFGKAAFLVVFALACLAILISAFLYAGNHKRLGVEVRSFAIEVLALWILAAAFVAYRWIQARRLEAEVKPWHFIVFCAGALMLVLSGVVVQAAQFFDFA